MPNLTITLADATTDQPIYITKFNVTNDYVLAIVHRCLKLNAKQFPKTIEIDHYHNYNQIITELTKMIIWINHKLPKKIENQLTRKPLLISETIKQIIETNHDPLAPKNFINDLIDILYQYPHTKIQHHSITDFGEAMMIIYNIAIQLNYKKHLVLTLNV